MTLSLASTSEPMTSVEALWAARPGLVSVTLGAVRAEAPAALRESLAALTTASVVMPNSRKRVAWSAEAPKCSMLTLRPASPTTSRQPIETAASTLTLARTAGGSTLSW